MASHGKNKRLYNLFLDFEFLTQASFWQRYKNTDSPKYNSQEKPKTDQIGFSVHVASADPAAAVSLLREGNELISIAVSHIRLHHLAMLVGRPDLLSPIPTVLVCYCRLTALITAITNSLPLMIVFMTAEPSASVFGTMTCKSNE